MLTVTSFMKVREIKLSSLLAFTAICLLHARSLDIHMPRYIYIKKLLTVEEYGMQWAYLDCLMQVDGSHFSHTVLDHL